jgi:hypothetical protein
LEGWKEIDNIHCRFCRITLRLSSFAVNNVIELELGRYRRRGSVLVIIGGRRGGGC